VRYPGVEFAVDVEAAEHARVAFGERHRDARHAAAVTGAVRERLLEAASEATGAETG